MSKKNQISAEITAAQSAAVLADIDSIIEALSHVLIISLSAALGLSVRLRPLKSK